MSVLSAFRVYLFFRTTALESRNTRCNIQVKRYKSADKHYLLQQFSYLKIFLRPVIHGGKLPLSIYNSFLAVHDIVNQINKVSHESNKGKPDTGHKWQDYAQNWRK